MSEYLYALMLLIVFLYGVFIILLVGALIVLRKQIDWQVFRASFWDGFTLGPIRRFFWRKHD